MGLAVPSLTGAGCVFLTACSEVETDDPTVLDVLRGGDWFASRIGPETDIRYVRVGFGQATGKHLHIDVVSQAYFESRGYETDKTQDDLDRALAPLLGSGVDLTVEGEFDVPLNNDLPAVIEMTRQITVDHAGVRIKMTGGRLSVTGAPVKVISWRVSEARRQVRITLEANKKTIINESYLVDALAVVKTALDAFIREGVPNAGD